MKVHIVMLYLILCLNNTLFASWVLKYCKKISTQEMFDTMRSNTFIFTHQNVPLFTQLLCSWNAIRPQKGHLSFYVQARNAHTKKWGTWHHMFEWGKDVQRSSATKSDGFTKYAHVRLETEALQLADAFRLKVVGMKGASIEVLKGLTVTIVNLRKFKAENNIDRFEKLASVHIQNVPKISQIALALPDSNRICSPVSCAMLVQYLKRDNINPVTFAKYSYDKGLNAYGSWPFNMAHAYECCDGNYWFYVTRLNSFAELHTQLMRGFPAVVSVRGQLKGAPRLFPQGHLLVVVGWDKQTKEVLCHDPSVEQHHSVLMRYKLHNFLESWERSHRLTYWVDPVQ